LTPHQVPYSIRMAADVMAQVLASTVQSIEMREQTATIVAAAETSSRLLEALGEDDNVLRTIGEHAGQLCKALEADALIVSEHGKVIIHGDVAASLAAAIVAALPPRTESVYQLAQVDAWPEALRDQLGKWAGVLVMSFDAASQGMLLALRMEQVESVRWGGAPEKVIAHGPLGPRLTPRGSFDEWRSTVRGHAQPWSPTLLTIASQLLGKISRSVAARNADIARARSELMAMLGHDLRDPLQAINMAGSLLEHGNQAGMIGRRIKNSTGRMQRLIGHVLDMSRINGGIGLGMQPVPTTLNRLLAELVDELGVAHPGTVYTLQMPDSVTALVDPDRMVQVLTNLLSNARHHGAPSEPVDVRLDVREGNAVITVKNVAPPIPAQEQERLFDAFKHSSLQNPRNRNGLGLGLYIAHEIVSGHEGTLSYHYEDPRVVFTIVLPQVAPG
jgi:chemotaxis family two-component system sensor kinase Cph1